MACGDKTHLSSSPFLPRILCFHSSNLYFFFLHRHLSSSESTQSHGLKISYAKWPLGKMKYMKPLNLFDELLKRKATEGVRLLGLDVGDKYIGLAISDPTNRKASPLSVLIRKKDNIGSMADKFQTLISEHNLVGFVVGYPFSRNRTSTDGAQVKLFIDNLCNTGKLEGLKYTYWEEGFTSKIVELLIKNLNLPQVMSKTITDKFAAAGILQGYLDKVNKQMKLEGN